MRDRLAILFLCAGLLLCCAVGISMLFGCAGVALLVLGYLVQRDSPEVAQGEKPELHRAGSPPAVAAQLRHVRILTIARPSCLLFDQDDDQ